MTPRKALEDSGMLTPHVLAHLATMALLIQQNRYDRLTPDVERVSQTPPLGVAEFVRQHARAYRAETWGAGRDTVIERKS